VERQGGIISLNSLPGFGTIAKVSFPVCGSRGEEVNSEFRIQNSE